MRLVPNTIAVAPGDGFKADVLERAEFGKRLTNLVLAVDTPCTLLLDGPWGAGKTTFVHMWLDTLKAQGIPVIYFNAFDNDYLNDAFTAIVGEFVAANPKHESTRNKLVGAAVAIGKNLAVHGSRYAIKAATLGAVDMLELADLAKDVAKDIGKDAAEGAAALIEAKLRARKDERSAMLTFRDRLAGFVADLNNVDGLGAGGTSKRSLVFIIDELDRCKPDFALALVESVKHLFSVPGVTFLLVTNLDQLCAAVQATYGASIDARGYLEKFYHLLIHLPDPHRQGPRGAALRLFIERIFEGLPSDLGDPNRKGDLHDLLTQHLMFLSKVRPLSLRKLERLATQIAVVYASTRESQLRLAPLIGDLCLMKVDAPTLYARARTEALTVADLETLISV